MRLLLDSHALIWSADEPSKITPAAMSRLSDAANELLVSAATLWEIAIKVGKGRLPLSLPYRQWMIRAMTDLDLAVLPITLEHAERQSVLPWHHRDPFDRMLVAQAQVEGVPLVSADPAVDAYGIIRIW